jgi:hypothetical protein
VPADVKRPLHAGDHTLKGCVRVEHDAIPKLTEFLDVEGRRLPTDHKS